MFKNFYFIIVIVCLISGSVLAEEKGVTKDLANYRKKNITAVCYNLSLEIPDSINTQIKGSIQISFKLSGTERNLILDFKVNKENLISTKVNKNTVPVSIINGHIEIDKKYLSTGKNEVYIEFIAGETSFNRNKDFLYTLLVPDRASTAFPCFDQPDIKALYKLTLKIPSDWIAVTNSELEREENNTYYFRETEPLSTYLFSFAAGKFKKIEAEVFGRKMNFYHRETDKEKVSRNVAAIFELHGKSIEWLEEYTNLKYPFSKFDFIAIPSFQYSGMEHPGNIYYNDSKLFLEKDPSQNQLLERASLIAHETAHIWFGDYVTMQWFDDVWLKEVFANFMAGKIVNPEFQEIDHNLKFLYANFPAAYSIDRTKGTHPVKQKLENMLFAGTLYGPIIYQKSPVVMQQLENMTGENKFREGIREYIAKFRYGNADWSDLVEILDASSDENIKKWSDIWVMQAGRPEYNAEVRTVGGIIKSFQIVQNDPQGKNRIWTQPTEIMLGYSDRNEFIKIALDKKINKVKEIEGKSHPLFMLINGRGTAYGNFEIDKKSTEYLLGNIDSIKEDLLRGNIWLQLYEELLNKRVEPVRLLETCLVSIQREKNPLIFDKIRNYISFIYNIALSEKEKSEYTGQIEKLLKELIDKNENPAQKKSLFKSYYSLATNEKELEYIAQIWSEEKSINGLTLNEEDFINLSFQLAIKNYPGYQEILEKQKQRIKNPDRLDKFLYMLPAVSNNSEVRDKFFESLSEEKNREREPWVAEALEYLHHPSRTKYSVKYLKKSLEMLEEIQSTGDIFFPQRWLGANFNNYTSMEAKKVVENFLKEKKDLNYRLKNKILQSVDILYRFCR